MRANAFREQGGRRFWFLLCGLAALCGWPVAAQATDQIYIPLTTAPNQTYAAGFGELPPG